MATRTMKTPPRIHPTFDTTKAPEPVAAPEPVRNVIRGHGFHGAYEVDYEVQPDGKKMIVSPPHLAGVYVQ